MLYSMLVWGLGALQHSEGVYHPLYTGYVLLEKDGVASTVV